MRARARRRTGTRRRAGATVGLAETVGAADADGAAEADGSADAEAPADDDGLGEPDAPADGDGLGDAAGAGASWRPSGSVRMSMAPLSVVNATVARRPCRARTRLDLSAGVTASSANWTAQRVPPV